VGALVRWTREVTGPRRGLGGNAFLKLAREQLAQDVRDAPRALAERFGETGRAARCGSIDDLRTAARRALPRPAFDFVDGAAGDEVTAGRNREAFLSLELRPRVMRDVSAVSTATTVLGQEVALPVLGAPHGAGLLFHPDAEVGIVRALHDAGTIAIVSSMASQSIEELAERAPGPKWIQMYMWRDRGLTRELIDRARDAGSYRALVLTVDTPRVGPRERDVRNGFTLPPRITMRSVASGVVHPRWSSRIVRSPEIGLANLATRRGGERVDLKQYALSAFDAAMTWDDVAWLREQWSGPIVIKGILTAEDGARAVEAGVDGIAVSNHGGRQLDHAPAALAALPRVVDAVGEVYLDGGVRRGTDVAKALALGATACMTARPFIYGLAVAGQAGAARAVGLLRDELDLTLALLGCPTVAELDRTRVAPVGSGVQVDVPDAALIDHP
jgi:L-lactate dehydrogenase (cytochrome)